MNVDQYTEVPGWWNREEIKAQLISAVEKDKLLKEMENTDNKVVIESDTFEKAEIALNNMVAVHEEILT